MKSMKDRLIGTKEKLPHSTVNTWTGKNTFSPAAGGDDHVFAKQHTGSLSYQ